ncbi:ABC transporter substrate binding protein [Catenovulum sediminis]|uniref:diguanylate cyclase n=1 Tax=Catenovulum sediminis TaxID=1740262 RepID=A0ABV1RCT9_9ALTE
MIVSMLAIYSTSAATPEHARVLLLNSYHPQYLWTEALTQGVKSELANLIEAENLHIEYMDERRFVSDPTYHEKWRQLLLYKYQQFKPDIIISSDDAAFHFLANEVDELFPNTPIIFGGVNVFKPHIIENKTNFSGILEGMEIKGNVELIYQLQPQVKEIILLADKTELGIRMVEQARSEMPYDLGKQVLVRIWDDFSIAEFKSYASQTSTKTAFLMLAVHKDKNGAYFSFAKELKDFATISKAPIYGMWGAIMIGQGVIGGLMNNPFEHGKALANMAKRVLSGTPIANIPLEANSKFSPTFDYNQLQKFNIDLNRLPLNSEIYFKPESFYQSNKSLVHGTVLTACILIAIIFILFANIQRRRKAETSLLELNDSLEHKIKFRTQELSDKNNQLKAMMEEMKHLANTDSLTDLPNRRSGARRLRKFMTRYLPSQDNLTIAMLDIDYFKSINDKFGHNVGDNILKRTSICLQNTIRPTDFAYRWGGEEFLILFSNTPVKSAFSACTRIQQHLAEIKTPDDKPVTVSIGIAQQQVNDSFEYILKRADESLYYAKGNGRNRIEMLYTEINKHKEQSGYCA